MTSSSVWAGFLFGAVALSTVPPAHGESASLPCSRPVLTSPSEGQELPANAPGLVFQPGLMTSQRPIDAYTIELRDVNGEVVPYTLSSEEDGVYLLRFAGPLTPGPLRISYFNFCSITSGIRATTTINVVREQPFPTTIGTVTASPSAKLSGGQEPCRYPAYVYVDVEVHLDPAMAAYRNVTRWTVMSAQQTVHGYRYGVQGETVLHYTVASVCRAGQEAITGPVTITAHVAGAAMDPTPVVGELMAMCLVSPVGNTPLTCSSGSNGIDGGAIDNDAAALPPDAATYRTGGSDACSIGGSSASPSTVLGGLGLLILALRGRRRRR